MDPHFRFVHTHPSPIPLVMHEEYSGHEHHDASNNSGDSVAVAEPALGSSSLVPVYHLQCSSSISVLWIHIHWIFIRILNFGPIWIRINVINFKRKKFKILVEKNDFLQKRFIPNRYLPVWIRIYVFSIRIRIHKGPEYGSNLNPDPQQWSIYSQKDFLKLI